MSVINNVLKDLDTRESRFTPIEIASVGSAAPGNRRNSPLFATGLVVLLFATAGWIYLQYDRPVAGPGRVQAVQPAPPVEEAALNQPTAPPAVAAEAASPNQIIGLQFRESEDSMRLEFALRERVVAYLKQRGEHSFSYHLRDIESRIVAPQMSDNRWIQRLSIVTLDQGVDINFETAPDILVETRQKLIDGEQIWAIGLTESPAAVAAAAAPPARAQAAVEPGSPAVMPEPVVAAAEPEPVAAAKPEPVKLEIKSTSPNAKSVSRLQYAAELFKSRRYADAEKLLLGLLNGAEDLAARKHLLALYTQTDRAGKFSGLVRESMVKYPGHALFKTEYARALFQAAAYRAVIDLFAGAETSDVGQQALLAASYQRLDQHPDAVRYYRLALAQDALNAKYWIGLGISLEHTAALEEALRSYRTAIRLGSLNSRLQAFVEKRSQTLKQVLN